MGTTLKTIYALLRPRERRRAFVVLALMLTNAAFALLGVGSILPFLTIVMDPEAVQHNAWLSWAFTNSGLQTLTEFTMALGIVCLLVIVIMNAVAALELWTQKRFIYDFGQSLSLRLMDKYLGWPYEAYLSQNTSALSKNILSETQELLGGVLKPGTTLLSRGIVVVALVGLLVVLQPLITLSALAVFGSAYLVAYSLIKNRLARIGRLRVDANTTRYKLNAEAFGGLKEVKVIGAEAFFLRQYDEVSRKYARYLTKNKVYPRLPRYLIESLAFGGFVAGVLVLMASGYDMTHVVPLLAFFAFAATRLLPGFQEILASLANFRYSEHLLQKLHEDLVPTDVGQGAEQLAALAFDVGVGLEGVHYRYPGAERETFHDLTLEIAKYSSVALVGSTGAGKTTIADLVLGLLVPQQGYVRVDDVRLGPDNIGAWRRKIGYVPQDVFLTDDTVLRNIAFAEDDRRIDVDAVEGAAAIAHIHDYIVQELPGGYDTVIGERGVRLSGGQRQRLGIARALYRDPELLVLDEATSDIDNVTEEYITEAIQNLAGKKTLLIIAHRLSTVKRCDRIYVVEHGEVVDSGTYEHLAGTSQVFQRMIRAMRLPSEERSA